MYLFQATVARTVMLKLTSVPVIHVRIMPPVMISLVTTAAGANIRLRKSLMTPKERLRLVTEAKTVRLT